MTIGAILELERKQTSESYSQAIAKGFLKGAIASVFFPLTLYKFFYPNKV